MSRSLRRTIKDIDIFGHRISLKFNQHGDKHQTLMGGFLTIILYILGLIILIIKVGEVQTILAKSNTTYRLNDSDDFEDISLFSEGLNILLLIEDISNEPSISTIGSSMFSTGSRRTVAYDSYAQKYMQIRFV